jgi:hypothetical protein
MCDIGVGRDGVENGTYSLSWDGSGDVGFDPSAASVVSYNSTLGRATVKLHIPKNKGLNVRILRSDSADPVHNISLVPSRFAHNFSTQVFQPKFLEIIKPFNHIRFTGWQKISSSSPKTWSTRTTPQSQTQHVSDGVAIEHVVDLITISNISSFWISFPHQSSDYNNKLIAYLKNNLPTNKVFKFYYESGCPESFRDSDRSAE